MITYTDKQISELFDHLEKCGWWANHFGVERKDTTVFMRKMKEYVAYKDYNSLLNIKSNYPYIYEVIFELPLRSLPLKIKNKKILDVVMWRLEHRL